MFGVYSKDVRPKIPAVVPVGVSSTPSSLVPTCAPTVDCTLITPTVSH